MRRISRPSALQSIDTDILAQVPDSVITPIEIKDDQKLPKAAQIEKKEKNFLSIRTITKQ